VNDEVQGKAGKVAPVVARLEPLGAAMGPAYLSRIPIFHHCASLPYRPPVALGMELPILPALGLGGGVKAGASVPSISGGLGTFRVIPILEAGRGFGTTSVIWYRGGEGSNIA
jgi:hypothetical protein